MKLKRFWAVLVARNLEFFRDRAALGWNIIFPVLLIAGFAFIFGGEQRAKFKVGLLDGASPLEVRYVDYMNYQNRAQAVKKLSQHQLDLVIGPKSVWYNPESAGSYLALKVFDSLLSDKEKREVKGKKVRYVDWVLPGILGMNLMFSSLFGVGYVIVRYRKNAVLKRLYATPLGALEFVSAQLVSRLFIVFSLTALIYMGCDRVFDFVMVGRYTDLVVVTLLGALCLIALGLLVASRSHSEELTGGLLNLVSWPMMLLSGVWFSLEGAPQSVHWFAQLLPLTHLVQGARAIMLDGASLMEISTQLLWLGGMTIVFLLAGAGLFKWQSETR